MPVKLSIDRNWSNKAQGKLSLGLLELTTDVHKRSNILAPKDTRAMVNSSRIEPVTDGFRITYGNARVPYARRQFYENRGGSYYLTRAADAVVRGNIAKYFRNK